MKPKRHEGRVGYTSRPICNSCGLVTSRVSTRAGKGIYRCTNLSCVEYLKTQYTRESAPRET